MSQSLGLTADYIHIEEALRSRWDPFQTLKRELSLSSAGGPVSVFKDRLKELTDLCPDKPVADLASMALEESSLASYRSHAQLWGRMKSEYVTVLLMSHALCEALINIVLAAGLAGNKIPEIFHLVDKADLKQKWLLGPKLIESSYELAKSGPLYEALGMLVKQRNAFVHYKAELTVDGEKVLAGSPIERMTLQEEIKWVGRYFSLPYDLLEHVRRATNGKAMFIPVLLSRVNKAPEHENA